MRRKKRFTCFRSDVLSKAFPGIPFNLTSFPICRDNGVNVICFMSAQDQQQNGPLPMSQEQIDMFDFALDHSWQELMEHFKIKSKAAICTK